MSVTSTDADVSWPDLLARLLQRQDLSHEETAWAMDQVMSGATSPVILSGFLMALGTKGETVAELRGLADSMLAHSVPIEVPGDSVDIVGTGGDRHRSVNISTTAAIVVAGAGLTVVKHGNRAASSASGAADVLEALGVRLDLPPARSAEIAREVGITFLFAASYHPAMRHAGPVRGELKVPTAFNVLGPLTNPAQPRAGAIGVGNPHMAPLVAGVFAERGRSTLVFRNDDGLDELAPTAPGRIWEVTDATGGEVVEQTIDFVADLGLGSATLDDLRGGDAAVNAQALRDVLAGVPGPVRETVLLNAAAAIVADGRRPGVATGSLVERLRAGLQIAAESVDSGAAADTLQRWVTASSA
ncbi:anthranilate phosphoribosyltransferase [Pseudactinotalea terrae]|uniref:anthranilate phosphoribosyltransferase n=1 Tax=Pseudactinotalea terrae TaxID=1743262 RepID=UPI001F4F5A32|nr:anthranilate phosphoribosyltransferase [Pseudactinotalea terrae]